MNLHATPVSRLGSRFTLVLDPYAKHVLHSALGRWIDLPMHLTIGVETEGGEVVALPFTKQVGTFDAVEQELRLCGVRYTAHGVQPDGYRRRGHAGGRTPAERSARGVVLSLATHEARQPLICARE